MSFKHLTLLFIFLACHVATSSNKPPNETSTYKKKALITLYGLEKHHGYANNTEPEHPLLCGRDREFPDGSEILFTSPTISDVVHVVFPNRLNAPSTFNGFFTLHGHFQQIKPKQETKLPYKRIAKDYMVFVVVSWNQTSSQLK